MRASGITVWFIRVTVAVIGALTMRAAEPMRIELEKFGFEMPVGFEDVTNYTFNALQGDDRLTISFGSLGNPPETLSALTASRREELIAVMPGPITIEGEAPARVDGLPGRMLVYSFSENNVKYRDRWALAIPAPDLYVQISYLTTAADSGADERFQHIIGSVIPAQQPRRPAASGYVRRWAKRMSLDVPATLGPITGYIFVAKENPAQRILLTYVDTSTSGPPSAVQPATEPGSQQVDLKNGIRVNLAVRPKGEDPRLNTIVSQLAGSLKPIE